MNGVLIIEAQIKKYRVSFYSKLYESLRNDGIELTVAYSDPPPSEGARLDNSDLPCNYGLKVNGRWFLWEKLLYQPLLRVALRSDLVIVDQGNRFILNHLLLPLSRAGLLNVAFWGLGENLLENRSVISEWYKRLTLNWVDWWFAYTSGTSQYLQGCGVPAGKITVVQNAIDTNEIQTIVNRMNVEDRIKIRSEFGISANGAVGIFVGALQKDKGISFLLEAASQVKQLVPDFHLIVVGGGPESYLLDRIAANRQWIHVVGPAFARRKAELLAASDVFLLPGRVGLAILDSFAGGLPLVTTQCVHGPEVGYLEQGGNGLMTQHDPVQYARAVADLLLNPNRLEELREGASRSAKVYSIEAMAENFRQGIQRCLDSRQCRKQPIRERSSTPKSARSVDGSHII
jgi:glycosyltransferase involved in cell wall biosynthesis